MALRWFDVSGRPIKSGHCYLAEGSGSRTELRHLHFGDTLDDAGQNLRSASRKCLYLCHYPVSLLTFGTV